MLMFVPYFFYACTTHIAINSLVTFFCLLFLQPAHALKDDIDVESSTVVPPAAVTLPPDVLAHGNDDASTNEEADDADH
ncbi:hypothetical protein V6N13_098608 [Hibiscus sabdariffa]